MAQQTGRLQRANDNEAPPGGNSLHMAVGVLVVLASVACLAATRAPAADDSRANRLALAAYRNANCTIVGKATYVTLQYGVDPRPDAKLTIYKCRDGATFATSRAYEAQLEADYRTIDGLDDSPTP